MNTLVIPDLHQRINIATGILERESANVDQVVFLGDYFDVRSGESDASSANDVCEWLESTAQSLGERGIWLIGNHDIHYYEELAFPEIYPRSGRHPFKKYACSGYSRETAKRIRKHFKSMDHSFWANLRIHHQINDILMSHAGIHPRNLISFLSLEENISLIQKEWSRTVANMNIDHHATELYNIGYCRGGNYEIGNILWQDWDHEFISTPDIRQIVGHTYHPTPRIMDNNFNIDTKCQHYIKIIDGKFIDIYDKQGILIEYEQT